MDCSKQVQSTTYKSRVRPSMEYASSSWDAYKIENADYLDKVQRRATLHVMAATTYKEQTQGCVTAMVNSLGWETLQDRRKMQRLTMLFQINPNLVEIPEPESIVWSNGSRRRGSQRFFVPYTSVTVYKMSFFPRTIQDWNKLPSSITDMQDIEALHATVVYSFNCKKWNLLLYILLRGD